MAQTLQNLAPLICLLAFAGLWTWEASSSARPSGARWTRWRRNLALSALNFTLGGAGAALMLAAAQWAVQHHWGLAGLESQSPWLAVAAGVLLIDLTDYARHRPSHWLPWYW